MSRILIGFCLFFMATFAGSSLFSEEIQTGYASERTEGESGEEVPQDTEYHVVVDGDTLWDLSGKYLGSEFRWKEMWKFNRENIPNPHLIYPGQKVWLTISPQEEPVREKEYAAPVVEEESPPLPPEPPARVKDLPVQKEAGGVSSPKIGKIVSVKGDIRWAGKIHKSFDGHLLMQKGGKGSVKFRKKKNFRLGTLFVAYREVFDLIDSKGEARYGEEKAIELTGIMKLTRKLNSVKGWIEMLEVTGPVRVGDAFIRVGKNGKLIFDE